MEAALWIVTGLSLLSWLASWCWFARLSRVPPAPRVFEADPQISVIVPARNEEANIGMLLKSLKDSGCHEVIVVDDQSEDRTAGVARQLGAHVLAGEAPPAGWLGKPWACHQGADVASGDWLLFIDADTMFVKGGFERLMGLTEGHSQVHSVCPYHEVRAPYEQLSAFFNVTMILGMNAFTMKGATARDIGLFGQVMLVSRKHYDLVGGHSRVRGCVLENFQLSRYFADKGVERRCWLGRNAISMRMFPGGIRDLTAGWSKGTVSGASNTPKSALLGVALWMSGLFMSAIPVLFSAAASSTLATVMVALYALWVIQCWYLFRACGRYFILTALIFPIGLLFYQVVFFRAVMRKKKGGTVQWKGRDVA